jgi:hypothetical protein
VNVCRRLIAQTLLRTLCVVELKVLCQTNTDRLNGLVLDTPPEPFGELAAVVMKIVGVACSSARPSTVQQNVPSKSHMV